MRWKQWLSLMAQLKSFGSINQLSYEIFGSCECKLILLLLYVMRLLKLLFMDVVWEYFLDFVCFFFFFSESCLLRANYFSFLCSMAAANAGRIDHTQPGPIDTSVLTLQPTHRSEAIWNGQVQHSSKYLCQMYTHLIHTMYMQTFVIC